MRLFTKISIAKYAAALLKHTGGRSFEMDVTDNGGIEMLVGQATKFRKRSLKDIEKSCETYAEKFKDLVQEKASHRPGPLVQTGGYRNSIQIVKESNSRGFTTSVSSNHPAARRLEYGFVGMDAMGRHYNQPPYPHWRPAAAEAKEEWTRSFDGKVPKWWAE